MKNFEDFRKQDRRKFATLSTRMAERATVAQLKLGETQLRTIGKILKIENADRMASIKLAQTMDTKLSAVSDKLVNLSGVVAEGVAKVIVKMLNILDDENLTFAKKTQEIKKLGDELTKLWDEAKKVRITP